MNIKYILTNIMIRIYRYSIKVCLFVHTEVVLAYLLIRYLHLLIKFIIGGNMKICHPVKSYKHKPLLR